MKIIFWVYSGEKIGDGHIVRSSEMATVAQEKGHHTMMCSNDQFLGSTYFQVRPKHILDLWHALHQFRPHWLVCDLNFKIPKKVFKYCARFGTKIIDINAQGKPQDERVDLSVIQGISADVEDGDSVVSGPKWVIIRRKLFEVERDLQDRWFVYGGSDDKFGLLAKFHRSLRKEEATLICTPLSAPKHIKQTKEHELYVVSGDAIFQFMASTSKACVAMGMTAWETAALGLPTYVYSQTRKHLEFALRMDEAGIVKAYPKVGVPAKNLMRDFLNQPFEPSGEMPDGKAAERILELMDEHTDDTQQGIYSIS